MRRHIPGLHSGQQDLVSNLDGLFLVRVERASYRWHPQKPFFSLRFGILEPTSYEALSFSGRLYCTERALWKLSWFLRDFGYDTELLTRDQVDEKALLNLRGVVRTSFTSLNGHSYQNLDAFAPAAEWEGLSCNSATHGEKELSHDDLSYTQIANYLRCPRSYRHRYLDGWREKETRAAMIFGRCFEKALESYFCGDDCAAALYREWGTFLDTPFEFKKGETWDRLVHQGVHFLERFAQDNRIRIPQPQQNLQIKVVRDLPNTNQFVAYIDAIGELDGARCLMDWKTTSSRYPEEPAGLLALDPQLICYSWITGISAVALVVFVRKHQPEIQYLKTSISAEQRQEFEHLVATTIDQIEAAQFPAHTGIRFPQNGCVSCAHLGLCLHDQRLIESNLTLAPGASNLAWLDELVD